MYLCTGETVLSSIFPNEKTRLPKELRTSRGPHSRIKNKGCFNLSKQQI